MRFLTLVAVFFLTACNFLQSTPEPPPPLPPLPVTEEEPIVMDDSMDKMMMMKTEALAEGCEALTAKTAEEKAAIMHDIAHNMDHGALDMILGDTCGFLGELEEVVSLTDNDLKLNPNDDEVLYFSAETNQFFATCKSMNTLAYVVDRSNRDEPEEYFEEYRGEFSQAAQMAKDMMEMMGDMEGMEGMMEGMGDMEMMEEDSEEPEESEESEDKIGGMYIDAFSDVEIANAAIGNGEPAALFFFASWCGYCQAKDAVLKKIYSEDSYDVSTYKLNYDEVSDLKATYGISTQDTVVLIDGAGNAVQTVMGATENDLKRMLSSG